MADKANSEQEKQRLIKSAVEYREKAEVEEHRVQLMACEACPHKPDE